MNGKNTLQFLNGIGRSDGMDQNNIYPQPQESDAYALKRSSKIKMESVPRLFIELFAKTAKLR